MSGSSAARGPRSSAVTFAFLAIPAALAHVSSIALLGRGSYTLSIRTRGFTLLLSRRARETFMAVATEREASALIEEVQKALAKDWEAASFASMLYAGEALKGFDELPASWLADNARAALKFIRTKPNDCHKLGIRRLPPAADGAAAPATSVIEILNDDMPFLVDSVLGELQARSLVVRFLLHPILKTRRDASGHLLAFTAPRDTRWSDGRQESYIAIHLDAVPEAEARDLSEAISAILAEVRVVVHDWGRMLERLQEAIGELKTAPRTVPADLLEESIAFLRWLEQGNF